MEGSRLAEETHLVEEAHLVEETLLVEEARWSKETHRVQEDRLVEEARLVEEMHGAETHWSDHVTQQAERPTTAIANRIRSGLRVLKSIGVPLFAFCFFSGVDMHLR
jgi:hypothetical protein